jgi:hypothetical protein
VIVTQTVRLDDGLARANVIEALTGKGAPRGVVEVVEDGPLVTVRFDRDVTSAELIDDLIAIESVFVPRPGRPELTPEQAAAIAAVGLGDPDLDASRIIETQIAAPR